MSQKNKERLYLVYGIVLSVLIVLLGVCLIVSCITIYKSGDHPFTSDSISSQFKKIIVPAVACLVAMVGSIFISIVIPLEDKKIRPAPDKRAFVKKLRIKLAAKGGASESADKIAKDRDIVKTLSLALYGVSSVPVFLYLFNESSFTDEINASIISLMYILVPCAVFAFAVGVFYSFYLKSSLEKEERALKDALASLTDVKATDEGIFEENTSKKINAIRVVRLAVFSVAVIFIVLGMFNGGMRDVLDKAIKICTECIGLG